MELYEDVWSDRKVLYVEYVDSKVRVVQDMCGGCMTAAGVTEMFQVEVRRHQGSALNLFLFAVGMDTLTKEGQESSCTMMFTDDILVSCENRELVEGKKTCDREERNEGKLGKTFRNVIFF